MFGTGRYAGASWCSYYGPDWTVMGLWDRSALTVIGTPEILTAASVVVKETAAAIVRQIAAGTRMRGQGSKNPTVAGVTVEPTAGLEPATCYLRNSCSTN